MGNAYTIGTRMIPINNSFLILTQKADDYMWTEISFKKDNKETYVGSFSLDHYGKYDSLMYNREYLVILTDYYGYVEDKDDMKYIGKKVKVLFDLITGEKVTGTDEELYDLYEEIFIGKSRELKR